MIITHSQCFYCYHFCFHHLLGKETHYHEAALTLAQYISGNEFQIIFENYIGTCQVYRNTSQCITLRLYNITSIFKLNLV